MEPDSKQELKNNITVVELARLCELRNILHTKKANDHDDLLKAISATQSAIGNTQKCLSESIAVITKFIDRHEPSLELVGAAIQTLSSIKTAITWLAAIVGSAVVIVAAVAAVWVYLTTPVHIQDFILK